MLYKKLSLILLGLFLLSGMVASYLIKQNEVTAARVEIPKISKEIKQLKEELRSMQYEVDVLENPERLLELARQSEYSHLKFPQDCHIVKANETPLEPETATVPVKNPLVVGSIQ
ncbi:MAG: hypothetical protein SNF33_00575 [Candidatus Algichlamydia australiensis]|nr:hypothetical protein [Chlamydiales bacterium]